MAGDKRQAGRAATSAGPQRQHGVGSAGAARAEHDLAVVLEQAVAERRQLRAARADPQGAGALRLAARARRCRRARRRWCRAG